MARHVWIGRVYRDLRENRWIGRVDWTCGSDLLAQEDVHHSSNKLQPKQVLSAEAQASYTFVHIRQNLRARSVARRTRSLQFVE